MVSNGGVSGDFQQVKSGNEDDVPLAMHTLHQGNYASDLTAIVLSASLDK